MEEKYWIWLSRIEGVGAIKIKRLLEKYKTPKEIWNLPKEELIKQKGLGEKVVEQILNQEYKKNLEQYCYYMKKNKIGMITILDSNYPENLKHIYDPPMILYYKGNKDLLQNENRIAIIGCRQCSPYGKEMAIKFSYELAKKGSIIISGMARGIDSYAHIGCLKAKRKNDCYFRKWVRPNLPKRK